MMKSDSNDALKMSNRNTLAFWIIVWLISVLTIGNLLLTLTIFGVLRLGKGMEFLEVCNVSLRHKYLSKQKKTHKLNQIFGIFVCVACVFPPSIIIWNWSACARGVINQIFRRY